MLIPTYSINHSKITADSACSHEIKRRLLLERKAMSNLDSILKSRDITLPTKVHLVKAMVFPVIIKVSLVAQGSRICLPMQETLVRSLVQEDPI